MARILLVDDERDLVWALRRTLSNEGYEVLCGYDGAEAVHLAQRYCPDLVVLDIAMPWMDGLQVCRRLRQDPILAAIPILFLSVRSDMQQRVLGLDEGGDDYLAKPFDLKELKAHIRALLRRGRLVAPRGRGRDVPDSLTFGDLTFHLRTCQVCVKGNPIKLTPLEFDLLRYLMTHPGEAFPSEHLLQQVWGWPPQTGDPDLVRWHVKRLRAKIETDPLHPTYIRTVSRHGYMFAA